jgi:hypothetical protein
MLKKPLEIEVFCVNQAVIDLENLNLPCKMSVYDVRLMTFFSIENISPWIDIDGTDYCEVVSGGIGVIVPYSYASMKKMLKND